MFLSCLEVLPEKLLGKTKEWLFLAAGLVNSMVMRLGAYKQKMTFMIELSSCELCRHFVSNKIAGIYPK